MNTARPWRYSSAIDVDESNCVPADPEKQHYTVIPESAYCSMRLRCGQCGQEFWFSANEQRVWYEEWGFWIDSVPKNCAPCRRQLREEHQSP
ncbi:MAG: zinc-ribbon domain containing protein [Isosphaeraceae bacterium]